MTLIEVYRGCEIHYLAEWVEYTDLLWNTPCLPGGQWTSKQEVRDAIDDWLGPEPYWELVEPYRGIDIEVYMPDGTPYRAYYKDRWDINYDIDDIKRGIDAWLGPEYPPLLQIENLTYPPTATPGDTVNINWDIKNYGGNTYFPQWTRLIDTDTNEELYSEELALGTGASKTISTSWTMPTTVWNLKIETGYSTTLTASRSVKLGGVSPILPIAAIALLAYLVLKR